MSGLSTQLAHRAALVRFDARQHETHNHAFNRVLETATTDVDANGAPLEREEATAHVHNRWLRLLGRSAPKASSADDHLCCVCNGRRSDAEPTLLDATLQPDGTVRILQLPPGELWQRRHRVTRTWCSAARHAAGAPPLPCHNHYLCEEHVKLLLAQSQYLRLPIKVRDWLIRGCCLECAFECAGEPLPKPCTITGPGPSLQPSLGSAIWEALFPRLTDLQTEELQTSLAPIMEKLLYPPGLTEEELAAAPFGNEVPVVRAKHEEGGEEEADEGEDDHEQSDDDGDDDKDVQENRSSDDAMLGERCCRRRRRSRSRRQLVCLPLRARNWCLECGCNPAVYIFKLRGELELERVLCPQCWVALRDSKARAAQQQQQQGVATAMPAPVPSESVPTAAAATSWDAGRMRLFCCLRSEMLHRLQVMFPRCSAEASASDNADEVEALAASIQEDPPAPVRAALWIPPPEPEVPNQKSQPPKQPVAVAVTSVADRTPEVHGQLQEQQQGPVAHVARAVPALMQAWQSTSGPDATGFEAANASGVDGPHCLRRDSWPSSQALSAPAGPAGPADAPWQWERNEVQWRQQQQLQQEQQQLQHQNQQLQQQQNQQLQLQQEQQQLQHQNQQLQQQRHQEQLQKQGQQLTTPLLPPPSELQSHQQHSDRILSAGYRFPMQQQPLRWSIHSASYQRPPMGVSTWQEQLPISGGWPAQVQQMGPMPHTQAQAQVNQQQQAQQAQAQVQQQLQQSQQQAKQQLQERNQRNHEFPQQLHNPLTLKQHHMQRLLQEQQPNQQQQQQVTSLIQPSIERFQRTLSVNQPVQHQRPPPPFLLLPQPQQQPPLLSQPQHQGHPKASQPSTHAESRAHALVGGSGLLGTRIHQPFWGLQHAEEELQQMMADPGAYLHSAMPFSSSYPPSYRYSSAVPQSHSDHNGATQALSQNQGKQHQQVQPRATWSLPAQELPPPQPPPPQQLQQPEHQQQQYPSDKLSDAVLRRQHVSHQSHQQCQVMGHVNAELQDPRLASLRAAQTTYTTNLGIAYSSGSAPSSWKSSCQPHQPGQPPQPHVGGARPQPTWGYGSCSYGSQQDVTAPYDTMRGSSSFIQARGLRPLSVPLARCVNVQGPEIGTNCSGAGSRVVAAATDVLQHAPCWSSSGAGGNSSSGLRAEALGSAMAAGITMSGPPVAMHHTAADDREGVMGPSADSVSGGVCASMGAGSAECKIMTPAVRRAMSMPPGSELSDAQGKAFTQCPHADGCVGQHEGPRVGENDRPNASHTPAAAAASPAPAATTTVAARGNTAAAVSSCCPAAPLTPPRDDLFPSSSRPELITSRYNTCIRLPGRHMALELGLPPPPLPTSASGRSEWYDNVAVAADVPYFEGALVRSAPHLSPVGQRGGGGGSALLEEDYCYQVRKDALLRLSEHKRRQLFALTRDHNSRGGAVMFCGPLGQVHDPTDMLTDILSATCACEEGMRSTTTRRCTATGGSGGKSCDGSSAGDAHLQGPYPWTIGTHEWQTLGHAALGIEEPSAVTSAAVRSKSGGAPGATGGSSGAPPVQVPQERDCFYGPVQLCCIDMAHRYEHDLGTTVISTAFEPFHGKYAPSEEVDASFPVTPAALLSYMIRMINAYGLPTDPRVVQIGEQCEALRPRPRTLQVERVQGTATLSGQRGSPITAACTTATTDKAALVAHSRKLGDPLDDWLEMMEAVNPGKKRSAEAAILPALPRGASASKRVTGGTLAVRRTAAVALPDSGADDDDDDGAEHNAGGDDGRLPVGLKVPVYPLTDDGTLYMTSGDLMRLAHRTLMLHAPVWLRDILHERQNDALDFGTCRPTDGGLGVFAHFVNVLQRPLLALELATVAHADRSQPATLMSFATPFTVPEALDSELRRLRHALGERKHSFWLQVRNMADQWRLQHPALAAVPPPPPTPAAAAVATAAVTLCGTGDAVQPVHNSAPDRTTKRGSVWVIIPGCRLHQLAQALNKMSKRGWPRNHSGFFSVKYGRDLDSLVAACWRWGVPFHVTYHCEGDLVLPGMAAVHSVMPLHCASMKISQDFLTPSGPALRLLWELDALRQEHHLLWATRRAKEHKVEPPPRAAAAGVTAAAGVANATASAAAPRAKERGRGRAPPPPPPLQQQREEPDRKRLEVVEEAVMADAVTAEGPPMETAVAEDMVAEAGCLQQQYLPATLQPPSSQPPPSLMEQGSIPELQPEGHAMEEGVHELEVVGVPHGHSYAEEWQGQTVQQTGQVAIMGQSVNQDEDTALSAVEAATVVTASAAQATVPVTAATSIAAAAMAATSAAEAVHHTLLASPLVASTAAEMAWTAEVVTTKAHERVAAAATSSLTMEVEGAQQLKSQLVSTRIVETAAAGPCSDQLSIATELDSCTLFAQSPVTAPPSNDQPELLSLPPPLQPPSPQPTSPKPPSPPSHDEIFAQLLETAQAAAVAAGLRLSPRSEPSPLGGIETRTPGEQPHLSSGATLVSAQLLAGGGLPVEGGCSSLPVGWGRDIATEEDATPVTLLAATGGRTELAVGLEAVGGPELRSLVTLSSEPVRSAVLDAAPVSSLVTAIASPLVSPPMWAAAQTAAVAAVSVVPPASAAPAHVETFSASLGTAPSVAPATMESTAPPPPMGLISTKSTAMAMPNTCICPAAATVRRTSSGKRPSKLSSYNPLATRLGLSAYFDSSDDDCHEDSWKEDDAYVEHVEEKGGGKDGQGGGPCACASGASAAVPGGSSGSIEDSPLVHEAHWGAVQVGETGGVAQPSGAVAAGPPAPRAGKELDVLSDTPSKPIVGAGLSSGLATGAEEASPQPRSGPLAGAEVPSSQPPQLPEEAVETSLVVTPPGPLLVGGVVMPVVAVRGDAVHSWKRDDCWREDQGGATASTCTTPTELCPPHPDSGAAANTAAGDGAMNLHPVETTSLVASTAADLLLQTSTAGGEVATDGGSPVTMAALRVSQPTEAAQGPAIQVGQPAAAGGGGLSAAAAVEGVPTIANDTAAAVTAAPSQRPSDPFQAVHSAFAVAVFLAATASPGTIHTRWPECVASSLSGSIAGSVAGAGTGTGNDTRGGSSSDSAASGSHGIRNVVHERTGEEGEEGAAERERHGVADACGGGVNAMNAAVTATPTAAELVATPDAIIVVDACGEDTPCTEDTPCGEDNRCAVVVAGDPPVASDTGHDIIAVALQRCNVEDSVAQPQEGSAAPQDEDAAEVPAAVDTNTLAVVVVPDSGTAAATVDADTGAAGHMPRMSLDVEVGAVKGAVGELVAKVVSDLLYVMPSHARSLMTLCHLAAMVGCEADEGSDALVGVQDYTLWGKELQNQVRCYVPQCLESGEKIVELALLEHSFGPPPPPSLVPPTAVGAWTSPHTTPTPSDTTTPAAAAEELLQLDSWVGASPAAEDAKYLQQAVPSIGPAAVAVEPATRRSRGKEQPLQGAAIEQQGCLRTAKAMSGMNLASPPRRTTRGSQQRQSVQSKVATQAQKEPDVVSEQSPQKQRQQSAQCGGALHRGGVESRTEISAAADTQNSSGVSGDNRKEDFDDMPLSLMAAALGIGNAETVVAARRQRGNIAAASTPITAAAASKRARKGNGRGGSGGGSLAAAVAATSAASRPVLQERPTAPVGLQPLEAPQRKRSGQDGAGVAAKKPRGGAVTGAAASTAVKTVVSSAVAAGSGKVGAAKLRKEKEDRGHQGIAAAAAMGMVVGGSDGAPVSEHGVALSNARDAFLTQSILVGLALNVSYTRCHQELLRRRQRRRAEEEAAAAAVAVTANAGASAMVAIQQRVST